MSVFESKMNVGAFGVFFPSEEKIQAQLKKSQKMKFLKFFSKNKRKEERDKIKIYQKKYVADLWCIFLKHYFNGEYQYFNFKAKKEFLDQKIIWQYWGQGCDQKELPDIVKLCFKSVDKYCKDYKIIRLDDDNLKDYIEFPDFIWEKRKNPQFKHAFFADLLRLALLAIYGGVWIDATIMLTAPLDSNMAEQDFFVFHRTSYVENKEKWEGFNKDYFGWEEEHYINVLNSFIVAKKNNKIISTCLDIMMNYWLTQNNVSHYFFFQIMFDRLMQLYFSNEKMLSKDDTLPHLLQYKMSEEFIVDDFNSILKEVNIHKLTYVDSFVKGTYIEYVYEKYGC